MPTPPDFGWREGQTQLGKYRSGLGLAFLYATTGARELAPAGSLWAWILAPAYAVVTMSQDYEPSTANAYPYRAAVKAGQSCSFPTIEAQALVAAGIAAYA